MAMTESRFKKSQKNIHKECEETSCVQCDEVDYVHAPIDRLGPVGRWIRHRLLVCILYGNPILCVLQSYRTPFRTTVMRITSFFGTEDFYTPLVGCLTWVIDARLGRLFCLLMGVGFYVSGFLKSFFCLPRPPNPPVVPLENCHETWGLPSHHGVLAVILPWYVYFYAYLHFNCTQTGLVIFFFFICLWCLSIQFSRLYLGVHSPADIVSGGIVGCLILSFWLHVDDFIDHYITHGNNVILQAIVYSLFLILVHPRPQKETTIYNETVSMTGVVVGFVIGRAMSANQKPFFFKSVVETLDTTPPAMVVFWVILARFIIGSTLVIGARVIMKAIMRVVMANLYRLVGIGFFSSHETKSVYFNTTYREAFKLPPIEEATDSSSCDDEDEDKTPVKPVSPFEGLWDIEYPVRYVTYTCMGWLCVYFTPLLFHRFGLAL